MKRLIITEEEKKNILSLYENTSSISESVLIGSKNPFINDDYVNYRKPYSNNLKDGDGFFIIKEPEYKKWALGISKNILVNKTIRMKSDKGVELTIPIPNFNEVVPNTKGLGKTSLIELFFRGNKMTFSIYVISDGSGLGDVKYYDIKGNEYYYLPNESKEKFFNVIYDNYSWSKVPDSLFELRQIKKSTSDF